MSDEPKPSSSYTEKSESEISGDGANRSLEEIAQPGSGSSDNASLSITAPLADEPAGASAAMKELRRLLQGDTSASEAALRAKIERVAHLKEEGQVEEMSDKLPEAIMLHNAGTNTKLANALTPTIEKTLTLSVERNPQPIVDAIFPVIGPAIRRSIREALKSMMDSVNSVLENSLSPQSMRWRLEAARTGKTFSEVVLAHTLNYRVEQLFLIDRKSGLLIQHLYAETAEIKDGDIVSGMLTAVQAFVKNTLNVKEDAVLESLEIDGLEVILEPGPKAILAAVVKGIPGQELKDRLKEVIEAAHLAYGHLLESYDGDAEKCQPLVPLLRAGMLTQYKEKRSNRPISTWFILALLGIGITIWLVISLLNFQRWNTYLDVLRAEPGLVVTETGWKGNKWIIEGLRDPTARNPVDLMPEGLSSDRVLSTWEPYMALDSASTLRRITRQLQPPASVTMALNGDTLTLQGSASTQWVEQAKDKSAFLLGISVYDDSLLRASVEETAALIEQSVIIFSQGSFAIEPRQAQSLQEISHAIQQLTANRNEAFITIKGYSSAEGTEATNQRLSQQRANAILEALVAYGIPRSMLSAQGTGNTRVAEQTPGDRAQNRSVTFSVNP